VPFGIGIAGPIDRIEAKRDLILQCLRAFQAAALEPDIVNNEQLPQVAPLEEMACA